MWHSLQTLVTPKSIALFGPLSQLPESHLQHFLDITTCYPNILLVSQAQPPHVNLSSYGVTTNRSCVSVTWEPLLDPPCPLASHVTTMTPPIYLHICPPYVILAATAPFVSCLEQKSPLPTPGLTSQHRDEDQPS